MEKERSKDRRKETEGRKETINKKRCKDRKKDRSYIPHSTPLELRSVTCYKVICRATSDPILTRT